MSTAGFASVEHSSIFAGMVAFHKAGKK